MYPQVVQRLVAKVSKSYVSRHRYDLVSKRSDKLFVSNRQEVSNVLIMGFVRRGDWLTHFIRPRERATIR
jgi:hypothetical protein